MPNIHIMTGNYAAAAGVKLCRIQVVSAYPITPQTSITESLSQAIESGELKAEYIRVESEHSVLTVCISASTVGARVFTSTSSHGLLYMHEQLHWAAGSRLPIVMCCVNRGVGAPWSIFNDQQDSISQRDTGWIQIYCRDNQEIIDTLIQAYRISEAVYIPVMVCFDGFVLSHTSMPVDIPEQETVDRFLPPYRPHTILSADTPKNINPVIFPWRRQNAEGVLCDGYMEMRHKLHLAFTEVRSVIPAVNADFAAAFGRNHGGFLWTYRAEDADLLLVAMGSIATEATVAVDRLREMGLAAGVVGVRVYRPFPRDEIRQALRGARAAIVFEKDISYGYEGALCTDVRAALYGSDVAIPLQGVVAGLGGRDVKAGEIADYAQQTWDALRSGAEATPVHWLNCATD